MSLNKIEDKRPEKPKKQEDVGGISSEKVSGNADKKLLSGTVQFYRNILNSLPDTFIAVYNRTGKHLEVWIGRGLMKKTGLKAENLKGKPISEIFDEDTCEKFEEELDLTFKTNTSSELQQEMRLPGGSFTFRINLSPLPQDSDESAAVCAVFNLLNPIGLSGKDTAKKLIGNYRSENNEDYLSYLITNKKGIITDVSPDFAELSGYSKEKLSGYKITHIPPVKPTDAVKFGKYLDKLSLVEPLMPFEWEWKNISGLVIWSLVKVSPVYEQKRHTGFRFEFVDITNRKLFEKELLKSKQTYKVIIENTDEGIFVLQDDMIKFCNSRLVDMLNYPIDFLQGQPFIQIVHPDDRDGFALKSASGIKSSEAFGDFVFRIIDGNKDTRYFLSRKITVEWDDNPAFLFYITDITAQKHREIEQSGRLEDAQNLLGLLLEFGEISWDSDIFRFIGKKIHELSGASAVLMISYDLYSGLAEYRHIEAESEVRSDLLSIIRSTGDSYESEPGLEHIRKLSFGKLIKYNDGIYEQGNTSLQSRKFGLMRKVVKTGSIYLLGFSRQGHVYGNAVLFIPEGKKPGNQVILENLAKVGTSWIIFKNELQALQKSEQKYRRVFESLQDVYFMTDSDGVITEVSPSVKQFTGYDPDEITGRLIHEFYDDKVAFSTFRRKLFCEGSITDYDIRCKNKAGNYIEASLNVTLLRNKANKISGSLGFLRDISKRKKAEEKYLKSEEKFRTLADFTYDWEYWISGEGEIVYMSPSCQRISGYTAEEYIKDPNLLSRIVHEDDYENYIDHIKVAGAGNSDEISFLDYRIITKDDKVRWINQVSREVFNDEGKYLGRRVSNRDITEGKLAAQELKNSEERFKALFLESPDAIYVEDQDGVILNVNPAACRLHKMKKKELVGKNFNDLIPAKQKKEFINEFPRWITGDLKNYRGHTLTSDGQTVPVEIHGSRINYSGSKALLFIVRDITEIIEKEDRLKESIEKAEQADMLKSAFLANVSHEIRTPMNAIIGFSEILTNQDLTQKEREEFIQYITQGGNTLMNLIEDIIDITKIEAGQLKIEFDNCHVGELLDELYATFLKMKNKNNRQDVDLRMNKPNIEEGFSIYTDPNRIRQILSNLLGNAIKFTKEGYIEFGFNLRGTNQIIFYVKDTGIGIPEDKLNIIFERFGQVTDKKNGEHKGTGLGLSISRKLAELLGGSLTVQSEEGKGSTFYLSLPVKESETGGEQLKQLKTLKPGAKDWSDKTFLIAEDSILNYTFLEALFQRTNVKLLWAKNGREAVEMCRKNKKIDLILMDIKMPILNGLEAISEIRKFRKDLPIIVQTAYAMPEDRIKSLEAGGDEHLNKPINADELFSTISRFLN